VRKQLENFGLQMPPKGKLAPEAFGAWQKAEIAKWWSMIKAAKAVQRPVTIESTPDAGEQGPGGGPCS
jgi:hypothetical protein